MPPIAPQKDVSDLVRRVLTASQKSLFQISRESKQRYTDPRYHIQHQFYSDLRLPGFTPNLQQILALSALTGYRLSDWLAVFGFRLDVISALEAILPAKRTRLIDQTVYDDQQWMPWFSDAPSSSPHSGIFPLGLRVRGGFVRRTATFLHPGMSPFLYAKVGWEDDFVYPDLLPGSLVRADTRRAVLASGGLRSEIVLVEDSRGTHFCHLPQMSLPHSRNARILGVADMEFRCLEGVREPHAHREFPASGTPNPTSKELVFGRLLAAARMRAGLSFREASALSRRISQELADPRYFCAAGALSDYETRSEPPRHVHKIISLAILYTLRFPTLLDAAGIEPNSAGQNPMPESLLARSPLPTSSGRLLEAPPDKPGFLQDLVLSFGEIPVFLRDAIEDLTGIANLSLRDLYWMAGPSDTSHPYLNRSVLAVVKRRSRRLAVLPGKPLSTQPLYLLLTRSGSYFAATCAVERNVLAATRFSSGREISERFRNGVDAEVVGKIVALLRHLPS
jgi:hypothetical protein